MASNPLLHKTVLLYDGHKNLIDPGDRLTVVYRTRSESDHGIYTLGLGKEYPPQRAHNFETFADGVLAVDVERLHKSDVARHFQLLQLVIFGYQNGAHFVIFT